MYKFIITGVTGFIGSNLVRRLLNEGHTIHVICRENSKYNNIIDIKDKLNIFEYDGNIENLIDYFKEVEPHITIHLASLFLGDHQSKDVDNLIESNLKFATQILEAMKISNCSYFINTSSFAQHVNNEAYSPMNLYAATKQAFEDIIQFYCESYNIKAITLELFDTYGPKDIRPKILNLLDKYSREQITLDMSAGEQILDLTYIDDIVEAYLQAIKLALSMPDDTFHKYTLESDNRIKLKDLIDLYEKTTNKKVSINWGAKAYRPREIMIPWTKGDILPGWTPKVSLEEGLRKSFLYNTYEAFSFQEILLDGPILINPFVSYDERGYLLKDYSQKVLLDNNIQHKLKEVFYTSSKKGVIRALHFQSVQEQAKLVRCISGEIYDVVVDLRKDSPTFGQWESFYLSGENKKELYIPEGFAHGYLVLEDSIVSYKCNEDFYAQYDGGIIWNDKDLNISWPIHLVDNLIISDKDKTLQSFETFKSQI